MEFRMQKTGILLVLLFVGVGRSVLLRAQSGKGEASKLSDPVLVGAGDVASCDDLKGAYATAALIEAIPGTVFVAGDLAYPDGSDANFAECYDPTWGD